MDWQIRPDPLTSSSLVSGVFVWDAENRLIEIKDVTGTSTLASYAYDSQSRRIARTVGTTSLVTLYDGWNPVIDFTTLDFSTFDLQTVNLWGLDLSGSMQGAGGVGGLLSVTSTAGTYYPTYDGNGNVSEYLDATGAIAAHYESDAFGNIIFSSGPSASSFRHRFSTKPQDGESGLYYYGYRYYDPLTGRWPSRDPIGEQSFFQSLIDGKSDDERKYWEIERVKPSYLVVDNDPISRWDIFGLGGRREDPGHQEGCPFAKDISLNSLDNDTLAQIKDAMDLAGQIPAGANTLFELSKLAPNFNKIVYCEKMKVAFCKCPAESRRGKPSS